MNENIDLTKILKDCPAGTKLYSTIFGDVKFSHIFKDSGYPIILHTYNGGVTFVTKYGKSHIDYENEGECVLFPSKKQRDWSKFVAPWYKSNKFDPKTLKPFDKVLARDCIDGEWRCGLFSHIMKDGHLYKYGCVGTYYAMCIPYNDETKHLVGTTEEAPEYYIYWEGYPEME